MEYGQAEQRSSARKRPREEIQVVGDESVSQGGSIIEHQKAESCGKKDQQTEVEAACNLNHSQGSKNVPKRLGGDTSVDSTSQAKGGHGSGVPTDMKTVTMSAKDEEVPNNPIWALLEQAGYTRW